MSVGGKQITGVTIVAASWSKGKTDRNGRNEEPSLARVPEWTNYTSFMWLECIR